MPREENKPPEINGKVRTDSPFYGIIEDAYRAFDYPKPMQTGVCTCCMDSRIEKDFYNPDIRGLPLKYVQNWYQGAYEFPLPKSIWGYLLPRILEILAAGEDVSTVSLEISLSRFPTGDQSMWSKNEWAVIDQFQRLYLTEAIKQTGTGDFLDDILCMFAIAKWPLEDLHKQVMEIEEEFLVQKLWSDWCQFEDPSIWQTPFWDKENENKALMFYTSRQLYERLVSYGVDNNTPAHLSEKALNVAEVIEWYAPRHR